MANTKKTSTKSTSTKTKTVPAKKPTTKPAGASKKPATYKEVSTKSKTTKKSSTATKSSTTNKSNTSSKGKTKNRLSEVIFGIIIIVLALAIAAGTIFYFCCGRNKDVVMIDVNGQDKIPSRYVEIADYQIKFLVPDGFKKMNDEEIKNTNFGISESVKVAYINEDKTAIIALSQGDVKITNDEVKNYTNAVKSAVTTAGVKDIAMNYYESDTHNVGTLKYLSTNKDQDYPFHAFATFSHDDKATTVNFECTEAARSYWENASDTIVKSIKFTENK